MNKTPKKPLNYVNVFISKAAVLKCLVSRPLYTLKSYWDSPKSFFFLLVTSNNIYRLENYTEKKICYCFNVFFKMYIICNLSFYPFLSIQFNGINYIHIVVQPSPLSICRTVLFLQNCSLPAELKFCAS